MVIKVEDVPPLAMEKKSKGKKRPFVGGAESGSNFNSGSTEGQKPIMDGMNAAEVVMVRKLAGNDPLVRKKTIRKLRKWLSALAQRAPETPECRDIIEPNLLRVWKALFYCMWMADKPLPQEQLAEQISDLVNIFASKPNALLIFIEWFFRTMAREWSWIDRLRLDKFMMLVRRFLRKSLAVLAQNKWKAEIVDGLLKIIRVHLFNHHPAPMKTKKGISSPAVHPFVHCPVGFQIHIIDIFLEELAKVDADGLSSSKVIKLLGTFIGELATNDDSRVLDEIRERVFHHLMRQSDVGMDYQEELAYANIPDGDSDEEEGLEMDENGEDNENGGEGAKNEEEDEVYEMDDGPLDPRAGAVDVVLPQLDIDYSVLADKLTEAGGEKTVKKRNRGLLYSLASQFREIVQGKYPLALPEEEPNKPAISKKELQKAMKRLLETDTSAQPKKRKTKKQRRREAKKLAEAQASGEALSETFESEDGSAYLNDDDLMDHVSDNYASYVHEQMQSSQENDQDDEDEIAEEDELDDITPVPKKKKKVGEEVGKEKKNKKYKTVIEVEADELEEDEDVPPTLVQATPNKDTEEKTIFIPQSIGKKKKKDSLSLHRQLVENTLKSKKLTPIPCQSPVNFQKSLASTDEKLETHSVGKLKSLKGKLSLGSNASTPLNRKSLGLNSSGPSSSAKKRVSFILARNSEHDATDYMPSIHKSPAIPFDANKTPTSGPLLKTPLKSARASGLSSGSPRKRALAFEFF